jgi:hypothetical protein
MMWRGGQELLRRVELRQSHAKIARDLKVHRVAVVKDIRKARRTFRRLAAYLVR